MRIVFCCISLVGWVLSGLAQADTTYQLLSEWPTEALAFTTDEFGRVYSWDSQNKVSRHTPTGEVDFFYANNSLGELTRVDARDPFNLLLYYPSLQTIKLLDRTLNPTRTLNLMDLDLWAVSAVALAEDGQIWLFDEVSVTLQKRSSFDGQLLLQSPAINWLLREEIIVQQLLVYDQYVYLVTQNNGILRFDPFGQLLGPLDLSTTTIKSAQFVGEVLVYQTEEGYFGYSLTAKKSQPIPVVDFEAPPRHIRWEGSRMYVLYEEQIQVYQRL